MRNGRLAPYRIKRCDLDGNIRARPIEKFAPAPNKGSIGKPLSSKALPRVAVWMAVIRKG
jgi:hypothetical protein